MRQLIHTRLSESLIIINSSSIIIVFEINSAGPIPNHCVRTTVQYRRSVKTRIKEGVIKSPVKMFQVCV